MNRYMEMVKNSKSNAISGNKGIRTLTWRAPDQRGVGSQASRPRDAEAGCVTWAEYRLESGAPRSPEEKR